jgi:hypothetical protein
MRALVGGVGRLELFAVLVLSALLLGCGEQAARALFGQYPVHRAASYMAPPGPIRPVF